jgi:ABC-type multidrug transport system ATPase subunit
MAASLLQVQGLRFAFPGEAALFDRWSLALGPGLHWLSGESGSGKTTLLRVLAGELRGEGRRQLDGRDADADPAGWQRAVCFVDAGDPAFDGLTPAALRDVVQRRHPALDPADWQRHVDGFGLAPHRDKTLHMLSTGSRRKAALAAVLSAGATLTLLDEPTAGLDAPSLAYLVQALATAARQPRQAWLLACGAWPAALPCSSTVALPER